MLIWSISKKVNWNVFPVYLSLILWWPSKHQEKIIIFNFNNIFKFFFPQQRKNNKKVRVTVKPHLLYRVSFLSKNSKLLFCFESTEGTKCFQYISRKNFKWESIIIFTSFFSAFGTATWGYSWSGCRISSLWPCCKCERELFCSSWPSGHHHRN